MILTVTLNPSLDEWVDLPTLRLGELNRQISLTRRAHRITTVRRLLRFGPSVIILIRRVA